MRHCPKSAVSVIILSLFAAIFVGVAAERPNVLFIVCDDLNTHVSTSGHDYVKTPAFDRLAASGMTFTSAYCQYPVCGPSRASFLHGLYPQSTGVLSNKVEIADTRPGTKSLPQLFKEAGYWTAATGKIFHGTKVSGEKRRWDEEKQFVNDEMPIVTPVREAFEAKHGSITLGKNRKLWNETYFNIAPQTRNQQIGYGPSGLTDAQHKDGKNARQAASWLEEESYGDQPFFMAVGIHKPHVPFLAPDKYFDMYPKSELKYVLPPEDFWDNVPSTAKDSRYKSFGFELGKEDHEMRRTWIQSYYACISFIDAQIGLVLDALEESGEADNTIVVLISDHGYQLGEHFLWGKVSLFDICDRVPFIVRAPGLSKAGAASENLVELVDVLPTLTDLCGIETPAYVQGKSLRPVLRNPSKSVREVSYTVVLRGNELGKAVRDLKWRYAKWPNGEELYDLGKDPEEHFNLAKSIEHEPILKKMRVRLERMDREAASQSVR